MSFSSLGKLPDMARSTFSTEPATMQIERERERVWLGREQKVGLQVVGQG